MPPLGAHMSIAGGYYKAVELAKAAGCDCVQIFTKNNNQWRAKPLTDDDAQRFQAALAESGIGHPIAHDSYLINLASPDDALWTKSVEAFEVELLRAEKLGVPYVVTHPGSYTTSSEDEGLDRIVEAIDRVHRQTAGIRSQILLENTAGQGSNLGWRFEHLQAIIGKVAEPQRVGVCIDTCHLLAAGYPLSTAAEYEQTISELDRVVGLDRVKAIHLNDSKQGLGSRVDRHEHIGRGKLGLEAFRLLLNDPRFASTPMYLETAKEQENGEEMDVVNLRTLRSLIQSPSPSKRGKPRK
jgi:deoxyribonuclease-4